MGTATEPLVRTVSVVYLYVSDMERSLAFYRDVLGIPLGGDADWQEATLGGTRSALRACRAGSFKGRGFEAGRATPPSSSSPRARADASSPSTTRRA